MSSEWIDDFDEEEQEIQEPKKTNIKKRKDFDGGFQKASSVNNNNDNNNNNNKKSKLENGSSSNGSSNASKGALKPQGESETERKQRLEIEALKRQLEAASKNAASSAREEEEEVPSEFQLSNKRKVVVREFRGKALIDIREYYTKDGGELAPGRKGISLTVEQYQKLKSHMEGIDKALENF